MLGTEKREVASGGRGWRQNIPQQECVCVYEGTGGLGRVGAATGQTPIPDTCAMRQTRQTTLQSTAERGTLGTTGLEFVKPSLRESCGPGAWMDTHLPSHCFKLFRTENKLLEE